MAPRGHTAHHNPITSVRLLRLAWGSSCCAFLLTFILTLRDVHPSTRAGFSSFLPLGEADKCLFACLAILSNMAVRQPRYLRVPKMDEWGAKVRDTQSAIYGTLREITHNAIYPTVHEFTHNARYCTLRDSLRPQRYEWNSQHVVCNSWWSASFFTFTNPLLCPYVRMQSFWREPGDP